MTVKRISATFTRPADTTAYTAGDVVGDGTIINFTEFFSSENFGAQLMTALVIDDANQATKPDLELWMFDTAPAPVADNAAFAPSDAEVKRLVGIISFAVANFKVGNAGAGAAGNVACQVDNIGKLAGTAKGDRNLYGVLVVRNAYTPVSAENFTIILVQETDFAQ